MFNGLETFARRLKKFASIIMTWFTKHQSVRKREQVNFVVTLPAHTPTNSAVQITIVNKLKFAFTGFEINAKNKTSNVFFNTRRAST